MRKSFSGSISIKRSFLRITLFELKSEIKMQLLSVNLCKLLAIGNARSSLTQILGSINLSDGNLDNPASNTLSVSLSNNN